MNGNKDLYFNLRKCERHLSTFGKKVLNELINQWEKARTYSTNNVYENRRCNTKKILNFNNDSDLQYATTISPMLPPTIQIYDTETAFSLNLQPEIHTSEQLITTINSVDTPQRNTVTDQFVCPSTNSILNTIFHETAHDETNPIDSQNVDNILEGAVSTTKTTSVNWDDMFDAELLLDIIGSDTVDTDINLNNAESTKAVSNCFNGEPKEILGGKRKIIKEISQRKIKKVKTQNNTKEHSLESSKKSGHEVVLIPKFRKQKYTKTVQNWLNDVESCNPINKDIEMENININEIDSNATKAAKGLTTKITIEKTAKSNKKVVQARLANKDGILKFAKPKGETVESKNVPCDTDIIKDTKEKRAKKFVPPIISQTQTPVKDVTYDIFTLNDNNINEYANKINFGQDFEIIAVLIYSNGFSQLNSHFIEDTCVTESILLGNGEVFYCFKGSHRKLREVLAHVLETNTIISYEARNILMYLATHYQLKTNTFQFFDVKIGACLLDPDNPPANFSDLQKQLCCTAPYKIATECPQQKASWYATLLKNCWIQLNKKLLENQLWPVFVEIEMKLLPIIAEMERRGVQIDITKLKAMEEVLLSKMKVIEQKCYKAAGKVFQINSTVQVRAILYDELQLDSKCNVKIRETISGGQKSTSEAMLRSLISVHELPKLILEYRHLHKAHATFLSGIAQHVKHDVVRPTWSQTAAATGRIASTNPNLQAIPKVPFNLVMFPDDADDTAPVVPLRFRSLYVSRARHALLAADFKHVECRVFAHAAADKALAHALAADDLFCVLAARWLNKTEESVSPVERERTKRLVYASLYGAGTRKLMEILDVGYEQALQVAASFNRTFPSLKSFSLQVVSECRQSGGRLSTLCGRVRHFTNISCDDFNLRSHAERQAVNFVVQGSAADLCKRAMVLVEEQLQTSSPPTEAHLLLQIHDELVWEVAKEHLPRAAAIIKRVMEGCGQQCGISTLLPVAITVGDNWGDMEPYLVPST